MDEKNLSSPVKNSEVTLEKLLEDARNSDQQSRERKNAMVAI